MLLLTLRGTPTLYYGDEIGMQQVAIPPDRVQDPFEKNVPGLGVGRDGCRTPMQWDATSNAGFSDSRTWLPLAEDSIHENVRNLEADGASILNLYKALIRLRRHSPELTSGSYEPIAAKDDLLIFRRRSPNSWLIVVLNMGGNPVSLSSGAIGQDSEIVLSTFLDRAGERLDGSLALRGNEGVLLRPVASK
jgi:alpha-glucosidase